MGSGPGKPLPSLMQGHPPSLACNVGKCLHLCSVSSPAECLIPGILTRITGEECQPVPGMQELLWLRSLSPPWEGRTRQMQSWWGRSNAAQNPSCY